MVGLPDCSGAVELAALYSSVSGLMAWPVKPFPHLHHVFDYRAMGCQLLFPGLLYHIQEAAGLPAIEKLEGVKPFEA